MTSFAHQLKVQVIIYTKHNSMGDLRKSSFETAVSESSVVRRKEAVPLE